MSKDPFDKVKEVVKMFVGVLYQEIDKNPDADLFIVYANTQTMAGMLPIRTLAEQCASEYAGKTITITMRPPTEEHKHGTLQFVKANAELDCLTVEDLVR